MKLKFTTAVLLFTSLLLGVFGCQKQTESEIHDTVVIHTQLNSGTPATKVTRGPDQIPLPATGDR